MLGIALVVCYGVAAGSTDYKNAGRPLPSPDNAATDPCSRAASDAARPISKTIFMDYEGPAGLSTPGITAVIAADVNAHGIVDTVRVERGSGCPKFDEIVLGRVKRERFKAGRPPRRILIDWTWSPND